MNIKRLDYNKQKYLYLKTNKIYRTQSGKRPYIQKKSEITKKLLTELTQLERKSRQILVFYIEHFI